MRHKSVDAYMTYQRSGTKETESNRLKAVLQLPHHSIHKKTKGSSKSIDFFDPNSSDDEDLDTKMPAASFVSQSYSKRTSYSDPSIVTKHGLSSIIDLDYWSLLSMKEKKDFCLKMDIVLSLNLSTICLFPVLSMQLVLQFCPLKLS